MTQRTVGAVDGEVNELACFAMLQLSCWKNDKGDLNTLKEFIDKLMKSIHFQPTKPENAFTEIFGNSKWSGEKQAKQVTIEDSEQCAIKMPWLVPACSLERLEALYEQIGPFEFLTDALGGKATIAALVPGGTNAAFDAKAYALKGFHEKRTTGKRIPAGPMNSGQDHPLTVPKIAWQI